MTPIKSPPLPFWNVTNGALAAGQAITSGRQAFHGLLQGRLRGSLHADQDGVLVILQERVAGAGGLTFTVTRDVSQPGFQYPFDVIVVWPYVTITWTQGAAPATFVNARAAVLPF